MASLNAGIYILVCSVCIEENYWEEIVDLTPNYETEEQNWSLMSPSLFKSWDEVSSNELQLPVSVVPIPPVPYIHY